MTKTMYGGRFVVRDEDPDAPGAMPDNVRDILAAFAEKLDAESWAALRVKLLRGDFGAEAKRDGKGMEPRGEVTAQDARAFADRFPNAARIKRVMEGER